MDPTTRRRDPVLLTIIGVIAALAVIAIVAVLVRGGDTEFDRDSPEGTVQRFTTAMIDGDLEAARDLVADEAIADCDGYPTELPDGDSRVTLRGVTDHGSTAIVRVGITRGYDGSVFGGSGYEEDAAFELTRDGDEWRLTSTPWSFDLCTLEDVR